jgi:hypothetical protein
MSRTFLRSAVVIALAVGVLTATQPAAGRDDTAAGTDPAERLAEAHGLYLKWQAAVQARQDRDETIKRAAKFNAALQGMADDLTAVSPEQGPPAKYTPLTLNGSRTWLDAIRFHTPAGKAAWDLDWEFVVPAGVHVQWYIIPRTGKMQGFTTFHSENNYQEAGANLPAKNYRVVQPLHGGILQPASEYIIWFRFGTNVPLDAHIRMGLTEAAVPKP